MKLWFFLLHKQTDLAVSYQLYKYSADELMESSLEGKVIPLCSVQAITQELTALILRVLLPEKEPELVARVVDS